jgi:hypothetical protein
MHNNTRQLILSPSKRTYDACNKQKLHTLLKAAEQQSNTYIVTVGWQLERSTLRRIFGHAREQTVWLGAMQRCGKIILRQHRPHVIIPFLYRICFLLNHIHRFQHRRHVEIRKRISCILTNMYVCVCMYVCMK